MDFQNIAYIVGGVFLAAALLIFGGRVREILTPGSAGTGKLASAVVGILLLALVTQQAIEGRFGRWFGSTSVPKAVPAAEQKAAPLKPAIHHAGRVSAEFTTMPTAIEVKDPAPATESIPAVSDVSDPDSSPPTSRGEKIVKSVGRFLHIGHKKAAD
jgi:hypothetical protein